MRQVVYLPEKRCDGLELTVPAQQLFRVEQTGCHATLRCLPMAGVQSGYELTLVVEPNDSHSEVIGLDVRRLRLSTGTAAKNSTSAFTLTATQGPRKRESDIGSRDISYFATFTIRPDLKPDIHRQIRLSFEVVIKQQDGEECVEKVCLVLAPREITIPTSIV